MNFFSVVRGLSTGIYRLLRTTPTANLYWLVIAPEGQVKGEGTEEHPCVWEDWHPHDFRLLPEVYAVFKNDEGPILKCATERTAQNYAAINNLDDPQNIYTVKRLAQIPPENENE